MRLGLSAAPDAAAMLLRGLDTLELRVRRQTESAYRGKAEVGWGYVSSPETVKVRYNHGVREGLCTLPVDAMVYASASQQV